MQTFETELKAFNDELLVLEERQTKLLMLCARLKMERDNYRFGNRLLTVLLYATAGAWTIREWMWLR